MTTELQKRFDELVEDDFLRIAESAVESVASGQVKEKILVNLSTPDIMMFDPVCFPEYKHLMVEYENGKEILICIGKD